MPKLCDLILQAKKALAPMGAAHEARILAGRAFLMTDAELIAKGRQEAPAEQAENFWQMVQERLSGVPLQYIIGEWAFMGLPMKVRKGVLIPRCDTETVAGRAIGRIRENRIHAALDLCCGSGCIAVAIAKYTGAFVTASDVSEDALELTRINAELNGVSERVRAVRSDLFESLSGSFGLIVSNPPYIPEEDIASLDAEVRDHEQRLALFGGADGLDFYRRIAKDAPSFLQRGGWLVLEVGIGQAKDVEQLLAQAGFEEIQTSRDLSGVERVVEGRLSEDR